MGKNAEKPAKRVDNKGRKLPDGFSQRKDGRYQARFTVNGKRYTIYDMELSALKIKYIEKRNEINNMVFIDDNNMKLNEWFDKWMEVYKKPKIKESSQDLYIRYWKKYIRYNIGMIPLKKIKRVQIVELYNKMLSRGIGIGSVKLTNRILNACLKQALHNDYIYKIPTSDILKELAWEQPKKKDAVSVSQQKRFLNYINRDPSYNIHYPFFVVGFGTGLRISELCALLWDDIDFDNGIIHVNKILTYSKYAWEENHSYKVSVPKTESSKRKIPMLPEVKEAFELQRRFQEALHIKAVEVAGLKDFVFTNKKGKPHNDRRINHLIKQIVDSYNKTERYEAAKECRNPEELQPFSTHIMRHTFASRCFESGIRPMTVQKLLGHSSVSTTENIYIHCSDEVVKEELKSLGEKGITIL